MSEALEHRDFAEALGAYALGALPDVESEHVRRHLASCRQCRAELEGLRAAVDALPASVPQIDPPPELKARLMEIVEAEAELLQAAGEPADQAPQAASPRRTRRWLPVSIPSPGLALACACVLAVGIPIALAGSGRGPGTRAIRAQLSGRLLTGGTRATVELSGTHARLLLTGLSEPAPGHVDELWVKRGTAAPQPAGTFVVRTGSVELNRPVRSGDLVMLTIERAPGTNTPTGVPLLVARA